MDVTKVIPHADYPLQKVGKLTLNRNAANYHAEVEQSAFSPSHFVPGIETSEDKMLQGRLFSYPDAHRHRLGGNYTQIPINCPYKARINNGQRDGFFAIDGNQGDALNHEPNMDNAPYYASQYAESKTAVSGETGRYANTHKNTHYEQAGNLYRIFSEEEKEAICGNLAGPMKTIRKDICEKMLGHFDQCDADYGARLRKHIGA